MEGEGEGIEGEGEGVEGEGEGMVRVRRVRVREKVW